MINRGGRVFFTVTCLLTRRACPTIVAKPSKHTPAFSPTRRSTFRKSAFAAPALPVHTPTPRRPPRGRESINPKWGRLQTRRGPACGRCHQRRTNVPSALASGPQSIAYAPMSALPPSGPMGVPSGSRRCVYRGRRSCPCDSASSGLTVNILLTRSLASSLTSFQGSEVRG